MRRLEKELQNSNPNDWELVEACLDIAHEEMIAEFRKAKIFDQLLEMYTTIKEEYVNGFMGTPQQERLLLISYLDRIDKIIMPYLASQ